MILQGIWDMLMGRNVCLLMSYIFCYTRFAINSLYNYLPHPTFTFYLPLFVFRYSKYYPATTSKATSSTTVTAQPITTAMESNSTPTPQASSEPQNQSGTSNPPDASDAPNASAPSYPSDASGVSGEGKETLNERGKLVITGLEGEGGFGVCRPRDEECGGFEI